ncbi:hypothetical protein [Nocardiopsis halophila]|uniref:hypothetical protein n=1 Tax=Nocardiopsis halophila TaxID=141692 RepID=UPI00034A920F|nr:hypothetical protein [Nocardiopsis halophila]
MSTPSEIAASARRTRILITVLVALVVVLAVVAAVAITTVLRSSGQGGGQAAESPSPSATPTRGPGDPLRLPQGQDQVEGLPVGFERTPEGAVAMVAAYASHDVTLDPEAKAQVRSVYAAELQDLGQQEMEQLAEDSEFGIENELDYYGFDVDLEDLPQQATYSALPVGAVYEEIDSATTEVALLLQVTVSDGVEAQSTFLETLEVRCLWGEDVRGGDWVISDEFPEIEVPEKAEPGTGEFRSSEWIPLQGGTSW